MTVYVESNFFLEVALGQEQAAATEAVLAGAEAGRFHLTFPALSIGEPFSTVAQRGRTRRRAITQINEQLRELSRSHHTQAESSSLQPMPGRLAQIEQIEERELTDVMRWALRVGRVIPIDGPTFAAGIDLGVRLSIPPIDAIILAAVVGDRHSPTTNEPGFFVSKNKKDYDQPEVRRLPASANCDFIESFDEAIARLGAT